jgi:PKD repeat protein
LSNVKNILFFAIENLYNRMKKLIISACFMVSAVFTFAQQHVCGTDEHYKHTATENAEIAEQRALFNAQFSEYMKNYNPDDYRVKGLGKNAAPKYIIPVVVHVFHQNGPENISDAQVLSEINFLNQSFRLRNSDTGNIRAVFRDIAADAQIEFRLAKKDPQGNCTNGIVRHYTQLTMKGNDELKKESVWDTKRYFNMWVVNTISRGGTLGIAGYAQFPFSNGGLGRASTDGIMVIHREFGNVGTSNPGQTPNVTTTTHEAGHWFGLFHPFQGDSCDNEGDGILETPTTFFDPSPTEPLRNRCNIPNFNSCSDDNPDLPDMQENFMDYFIGPCASNMFTLAQVARMHFCLETYRRELWQPENLVRTGVNNGFTCTALPIASFNTTTPERVVCEGSTVNFRDNSHNAAVTSWLWNFGEGATPATATTRDVNGVSYSTSGWKTVTLTATGPTGSNTRTIERFIFVQGPSEIISLSYPVLHADWDYLNNYKDLGWTFDNETNIEWIRTPTAQVDGNHSLMLNPNLLNPGFTYSIVSPTFNLSGTANPYFQFSYAFAANFNGLGSNVTSDQMNVQVSFDCGKNWVNRRTVGGNPSNNPTYTNNPLTTAGAATQGNQVFIPINANQWRTETLSGNNIGSTQQRASVRFRVSFTYQGGNYFYIDGMRIGLTTGNEDLTAKDINFNVVPNPFNTEATVNYELNSSSNVTIELYDLVGKRIAELQNGMQQAGTQTVTINKNDLGLNSGLYFVKTTVGASSFSTKVLIN